MIIIIIQKNPNMYINGFRSLKHALDSSPTQSYFDNPLLFTVTL